MMIIIVAIQNNISILSQITSYINKLFIYIHIRILIFFLKTPIDMKRL